MPGTKYFGGQSPYTYSYDNRTEWRRFRMLNPCRGMYHDVRRRLPHYWSDIRDALTYRTIASTIRIYFINILPAIAYTLDMYRRTGEFYGINEALFSSALAAMVFSVLGAQPLTIVGITGLISLFNYTIYDIIVIYEPAIYANFMCWTAIWAAIFHWIVAVCNLCDYMRYVTDFSSESFGAYVGIIYCIKGVEELVNEFTVYGPTAGFMSCMIAILIYLLSTPVNLRLTIRQIGTIFWVGFAHIPGNLKATGISFVPITRAFYPTQPRGWLIHFWELETKWVFAALPFGFLVMLLFYYDHNVSSLGAQGRQYPLEKPAGFHWDFFLLGCTTFIAGITGIPMPNGLVPQVQSPTFKHTNSLLTYPPIQAPVHTTSLTVTETTLHIIPISDPESEGTEICRPIITPTAVIEQRISHFLMGLAIIGTMTGPLLIVLHTMPAAVFAGVFFIVGWGSIESNGILHKIIFLLREDRFIPRNEKLLRVPRRKIMLYVMCQVIGVAACVAISQTIAAIGFPILIIGLIPFRVWVVPRWFGVEELGVLDGLTADGEAVLCSLGGPPRFPGEARGVEGERQKGGE
ncbi:hypothetical protein CBS63078_254 [Aspergillus niger]|nr:hypothetical protein CBS11350_3677 [Aspergillus niger]KAI2944252.1 hypothetical protein CBS63078_254 [Aspergillus niger]KAI3009083.1 hypothetical protein CBS147345_6757 [Aspergillus niger]KAI3083125.1 hypothetical protein CBS147343_2903 [Aspergillus niger]SPB44521.1 unnamed protein product [Aspergillus niger]